MPLVVVRPGGVRWALTAPMRREPWAGWPEQTVPEQTVAEQTVPERTVPEQTVPEQTGPEQTGPEPTGPEPEELQQGSGPPGQPG